MARPRSRSTQVRCEHFLWNVRREPSGVYYAECRRDRIDVRRSLGTRHEQEALAVLKNLDLHIATEMGLIKSRPSHDGENLPIAEAHRLFCEKKRRELASGAISERTMKKYAAILEVFERYAAKRRLDSYAALTRAELERFIDQLKPQKGGSAPMANKTKNGYARIVHQVQRFLIDDERLLGAEYAFTFRELPERPEPRHVFTADEFEAMLEQAQSSERTRWMHPILLALGRTGLRIRELAGLRHDDVDLERRILLVRHDPKRGQRTKAKKTRRVPIADDLAAVLAALPRTDHLVFHSARGGRLNPDRVLESFKRDIRDPIAHRFPAQDGGPGFASSVIHSFRHFAVNEARRAGLNADLRKAIFGHADDQVHDIYVTITDDEIGAAAGRMAGLEERRDHHLDSQPPAAPGRQDQAEHHREHNPSRNPAGRRSREGSV